MGYLHIDNLYKDQRILLFRECYALEKIHGTSVHVAWREERVQFSSGGEKHQRFVALFDESQLTEAFGVLGYPVGIERMRDVIAAMVDDVLREGAGEIVDSREARSAIGKKTAEVFKAKLKASLQT